MIDDDGGESGASTRATSVEPEIGTAHLLSSHPREELKTLGGLDALTTPEPPVEPLDRPTSPDVAPPQHPDRLIVGEQDNGAPAFASPPRVSTPLPLPQSEAAPLVLREGEWEIRKIIGKRRAGKGYEYKVRWRETWLPKSELGNAKRLRREFEVRGRAQRDGKECRPGRADKDL